MAEDEAGQREPRAPIRRSAAMAGGLRGLGSIVLTGFEGANPDTVTKVTDKDGKKLPDDTDTSVDQDHYFA